MHACWMTILVIGFWKIFEGKLSIITRPKSPLEMLCEFMLKLQVGVIRKIDPDDNFQLGSPYMMTIGYITMIALPSIYDFLYTKKRL